MARPTGRDVLWLSHHRTLDVSCLGNVAHGSVRTWKAADATDGMPGSVCVRDWLSVPTTLRAGVVTLRPLLDGDFERLVRILGQAGVREWWGSLDDVEHTIEGLRNDGGAFAIEVDGVLAGWLGYNEESEPDYRHASLDIFLAPEHQGRRLGRTALRLVAAWLFEQREHHRLMIDPACDNAHAIRAYEAVGFRPVGVMRRYERGADGNWHDNLLMDLLREDLAAGSPATSALC